MLSKRLVKTVRVTVGAEVCAVNYYEVRTLRGVRRVTSEIVLPSSERIILDDDSLEGLESRVERVVPAMVYSRRLAGATAA